MGHLNESDVAPDHGRILNDAAESPMGVGEADQWVHANSCVQVEEVDTERDGARNLKTSQEQQWLQVRLLYVDKSSLNWARL